MARNKEVTNAIQYEFFLLIWCFSTYDHDISLFLLKFINDLRPEPWDLFSFSKLPSSSFRDQ
jgi:hypothetical protein